MIFDLIVIAVLIVSCVIAFLRGFIRETLTIMGVVGGAFAAIYAGPGFAPVVHDWLGVPEEGSGLPEPDKIFGAIPMNIVADIVAYGGIFIVVVIVLSIFSHILSGWAKAVGLGSIDRSFGVVFGIARAVVLLALLYIPIYLVADEETRDGWQWMANSKTLYYIEGASSYALTLLPESMVANVKAKAEGVDTGATREKLKEMNILSSGGLKQDEMDPAMETAPDEGMDGGMNGEAYPGDTGYGGMND
jgi:membrane protein required for colicin V production